MLRCEPRVLHLMPVALLSIAGWLGACVHELSAVRFALAIWSVRPGAGSAR